MIKPIGIVVAMMIFGTAVAQDITVINQSPKASVMTGLALRVQSELGKKTDFYQSRDCKDAAEKFKMDPQGIIIYATDNAAVAASKNIDCEVEFVTKQVVVSAWQSFSFCRLPSQNIPLHQANTIGMSGMHPYRKWTKEFNSKNNASLSVRVFQGSSATLKALLANEIDWGFVATATAKSAVESGMISCDYTTDPRDPRFISRHYRHELGDIRLQVAILYNGVDNASVRETLKKSNLQDYLTKSGYTDISFGMDEDRKKKFDVDYQKLKSFY